ncbi:MAG: hypothetical protein BWY68_00128 [bacterium ADurb.Bin400]|nr:MAG: hypothetical protein BWY68_00128 [bacterium ADurb.Bin400]
MTLSEVFSKSYLLDPIPPQNTKLYVPLIVVFSIMLILAVVTRFLPVRMTEIKDKYFPAFLVPGIMGFTYLFGRYERLAWLGSRAYLVIVLVLFAVWIIVNSLWVFRVVPRYTKEVKTQERYEKYLPKRKGELVK